jgi:tRNA (guanosine-2'-O-)-methyltransferase
VSPRKRPVRAWIGTPPPVDPAELLGPRGLTAEVLASALESPARDAAEEGDAPGGRRSATESGAAQPPRDPRAAQAREAAFWWPLLTEARQQRILSVIEARLSSVTIVLDRLIDPHNTAAILRTSEGLGLCRAHVIPHEDGADAHAHRQVTQDADKWIDVELHGSGAGCATALKAQGFEVWAGHLDGNARLYTELPVDRPVALLFGNEHEGPREDTLSACAGTFRIPMAGFTQSFNVSVAAAIALSQHTRARRQALQAAGDLAPAERAALQDRFTLLAAKLSRRFKPVNSRG